MLKKYDDIDKRKIILALLKSVDKKSISSGNPAQSAITAQPFTLPPTKLKPTQTTNSTQSTITAQTTNSTQSTNLSQSAITAQPFALPPTKLNPNQTVIPAKAGNTKTKAVNYNTKATPNVKARLKKSTSQNKYQPEPEINA